MVCSDLHLDAAQSTEAELTRTHGAGIGVAGSGISACGPAAALACDVTDRASVRRMLEQAVLAYGGLDNIVITAGVFPPPDREGRNSEEQWSRAFDVNVIGAHTVVDEARAIFARQGLRGSVVLTTSVNAVVAKKGSLAYDASKAAANHLTRGLAVELAPLVRVNAVAPATVVEGSTMFPRDRVIASLVKYGILFDEVESTDALRARLASFYANRTLTKAPVTPADQAEAVFFLISERSSKTTGQILTVDGGLVDAFLR